MTPCATQIFHNLTKARFDCLVLKAAASGIAINGLDGQTSKDGLTMRWKYDALAQTFELQYMDAPFFLSCGTINNKIHDLMDGCP